MAVSAFQADAFQFTGFQIVGEEPTPTPPRASGAPRPLPPGRGRTVQQDDEEVLMVVLSAWTVINQRRH